MIPKGKRPRDPNQLAAMIVGLSTGEIQPEPPRGKAGGLKGGKARAASLSADKRAEIAQKAAAARWNKD